MMSRSSANACRGSGGGTRSQCLELGRRIVATHNLVNRREFLGRAGGAVLGGSAALAMPQVAFGAAAGGEKPNFVFILVDDMGWADLTCYGSTFYETPNIDKLAGEGMRFTDAYAACPVCSPTRGSILTGRYPARLHLTDFIPGHLRPWAKLTVPEFNQQLPLEEVTIAEALQPAGYVSACIGKWHLGGPEFNPDKQGFAHTVMQAPNNNDKRVGALTDEAVGFMEANKDRPFFLYLAHHTVHIPLEARQELIDKYEAKAQGAKAQGHPTYAAMIETLDESIAQLVKTLDELKIADRTVVIFFSDNGGLIQRYDGEGSIVTSNAPLRSEKGTLYEGGIRDPLIVRWPGVVSPGSVCDVPVTSVDFYPTMLEMAAAEGDAEHVIDGESIVPVLRQTGGLERDAIYWHYPHYHHTAPCAAVRDGKYKLIEFYEDGALELYDLEEDIGEQDNLAAKMPRKAAELRAKLDDWRRAANAQMPTLNPSYDPARAHVWGRRRRKPAKK